MTAPRPGSVGWIDLTVDRCEEVRDFYRNVAGWTSSPVKMGDYDDYCMIPPGADAPVAGICHARGLNEGLPPAWLIYITVESMDGALARVREHGGEVLHEQNHEGHGRSAVIRDPAGAVAALYEPATTNEPSPAEEQ